MLEVSEFVKAALPHSDHDQSFASHDGVVQKSAKGLAYVLLFANYERLLKQLTRSILIGAQSCRVSHKRLKPGIRSLVVWSSVQSLRDKKEKVLHQRNGVRKFLEGLDAARGDYEINAGAFPNDGSFMKLSQLELWCEIFDLPTPATLMPTVTRELPAVVRNRNKIAHGESSAQEVGREYSSDQIFEIIRIWDIEWNDFIDHVETAATCREFYRI